MTKNDEWGRIEQIIRRGGSAMPIQIPNDLPAAGTLQNENIFVMNGGKKHLSELIKRKKYTKITFVYYTVIL